MIKKLDKVEGYNFRYKGIVRFKGFHESENPKEGNIVFLQYIMIGETTYAFLALDKKYKHDLFDDASYFKKEVADHITSGWAKSSKIMNFHFSLLGDIEAVPSLFDLEQLIERLNFELQ